MPSLLTRARRSLLGLTSEEKLLLEHYGTPDRTAVLAQHAQATQTVLAQAAARPPSSVSTGARANPPVHAVAVDFRCWAKFVRNAPATPYKGTYGFDWINWKRDPDPKKLNDQMTEIMTFPVVNFTQCYDPRTNQYVSVASDVHLRRKLQDKYRRIIVYGDDYYAAWLSMRPNQKIEVQLHVEALNAGTIAGDYLTFGAHASYQVTVGGQVNEAIRIVPTAGSTAAAPQVVDVTIKCLKASTDTALKVFDEKGTVVGQVNVVSNVKTYKLPLRVVYLVKDGAASSTNLTTLQTTLTGLKLETFLNEHALNQAQIQVAFEKTSPVHQIVFKEAEWAGKYYNRTTKELTDLTRIDPLTGNSVLVKGILTRVMEEYAKLYEGKNKTVFKGLVIFVTDLSNTAAGGLGTIRPVNARSLIIFGTNLSNKGDYAHEIGHVLGLDHTFLDAGTNQEAMSDANYIIAQKNYIKALKLARPSFEATVVAEKKTLATLNADIETRKKSPRSAAQVQLDTQALQTQSAALKKAQKQLADIDKNTADANAELVETQRNVLTFGANPFKFKQGTTATIMDYCSPYGESYFYWQWGVMQRDVLTYYSS